jgi:hypothetical protein
LAGDGVADFCGLLALRGEGDRFGEGLRLAEASFFLGELFPEALAGEDLAGDAFLERRGDDLALRGGDY